MDFMKLVFATGNPGKLREAAEILGEGFELVTPAEVGITEEIPETGSTLRANSLQKAQYIYENSDMRLLFDAARGSNSDNLKLAAEMLKRMKQTNNDG